MRLRTVVASTTRSRGRYPGLALPAGFAEPFTLHITASSDDAFEIISTGAMDLTSPLNIGLETTTDAPVLAGFRFDNVPISGGVAFARLRFVARSANTPEFVVRIKAQAHDDAPTFTTATSNISARTLTTAFVDWSIPAWIASQDDADTISPDLSAIVTEVTERAGWASGNAIAFVLSIAPSDPSLSRRRIESYDSTPALAPRFTVNSGETEEPEPPPAPTGDFADAYDLFGLVGIEGGTTSTQLKDGTSMGSGTGSMKYYFDAYMTALLRSDAYYLTNIDSRMGHTDVFHVAREGGRLVEYALNVFRLTGHLPILDRLIYGWNLVKANFRTTFEVPPFDEAAYIASGMQKSCGGVPWSPFPKLLYRYDPTRHLGTDTERGEPHKFRSVMAQFAWALHMNRGKTSPGGYNYATEADYWAERVEEYVDAWSMGPWPEEDCWRFNYRGCDSDLGFHSARESVHGRRRAPHGVWPICVRNAVHKPFSQALMHRYIGLLGQHGNKASAAPLANIINPEDAQAGGYAITDLFVSHHYEGAANVKDGVSKPTIDSYGRDSYIATGAILGGSRAHEAARSTYTGNVNSHALGMWMSGAYRGSGRYSRQRMLHYARAMGDMLQTDGSTLGYLGGPIDYGGHGLLTGPTSIRSTTDSAASAYPAALIWADEAETGGDRLWNAATAAQNSAGGGYGTGCKMPHLPAAQFIKRALDAVGDLD